MAKSKSRGGDQEHFARIPESAMLSDALRTAPHAAFKILAILLMGKAKERNGTLMCTDGYAEKFGISSRETVQRSLQALQERGLTVRTRQGMKLRKVPTLWAVTWWPIFYRNGQPLDRPEDPTHAYLKWATPIVGVKAVEIHTDGRGNVTPIVGVDGGRLHTDLPPESGELHTDGRGYSKSLVVVPRVRSGAAR